ncbi:GNAT family N-acetyltransferase [candidate division KSB1 bacterium]|nr:GNAT family N-acetyltransferase [candidate division KSB1 bacterium]
MVLEYIPAKDRNHFKKLKSAYNEIFNTPEVRRYLSFTMLPFDQQTIDQWFTKHLQSGIRYFINEEKGVITGILIIKVDRSIGFELFAIGVRSEHRGNGIGRRLVEIAIELARKESFRAVDVRAFCDNKPMLKLLIDLDFIPARIDHHIRADGADVLHLKKYLR